MAAARQQRHPEPDLLSAAPIPPAARHLPPAGSRRRQADAPALQALSNPPDARTKHLNRENRVSILLNRRLTRPAACLGYFMAKLIGAMNRYEGTLMVANFRPPCNDGTGRIMLTQQCALGQQNLRHFETSSSTTKDGAIRSIVRRKRYHGWRDQGRVEPRQVRCLVQAVGHSRRRRRRQAIHANAMLMPF